MSYYTDFEGEGPRVRPHPGWVSGDSGDPLNDAELFQQGFVPVRSDPPGFDPRYQRLETLPIPEWEYSPTEVKQLFRVVDLPLLDVIQMRVEEVRRLADDKLAMGYPEPTTGLHISYDNDTRTDVNGIASYAILSLLGAPWGEGAQRGFISIENPRVPLPTPEVARDFAAGYGDYYTAVKQHGRDLKDELLLLTSIEDVLAFDVHRDWPASAPVETGTPPPTGE